MEVNGTFSQRYINFAFMGERKAKAKPEPASSDPLYTWFKDEPGRRADFSQKTGFTSATITNWRTRGIPRSQVERVALAMGLTYDKYMQAAAGVPAGESDAQTNERRTDAEKLLFIVEAFLDTNDKGKSQLMKSVGIVPRGQRGSARQPKPKRGKRG